MRFIWIFSQPFFVRRLSPLFRYRLIAVICSRVAL